MKIKVVETAIVRPAAATPSTTVWISNLDMQMPANYHTLTHYFYRRPTTGASNFFVATVLKEALSRALVDFYPVAGRLNRREDNRIEINCNSEGALFVEAEADEDMDGSDLFAPSSDPGLIPAVDYSKGISTYPLFIFQVTHFKCGGVCLGIANEHHLSDGASAFHFINTWSDIARGVAPTISPFLDRTVLSARNPPCPLFPHVEYHPPPPPLRSSNNISGETMFSVFKLTRNQLTCLKTACQAAYSTYEAVAAHLWRCLTIARGLPDDQVTKLHIPVDGRTRLQPPLPPGYFGNVIFTAAPILSCGELRSSSLRHIAQKVHEALVRMDDEYLRSALDYLEMQEDQNVHARGVSSYSSPNLGIISWTKFPLYDANFGWGKPVSVGLRAIPSDGKIVLLPSPMNDGSLLFAISMKNEQMQVFKKLLYDV